MRSSDFQEDEASYSFTNVPRNNDTLSDATAEEECLFDINDIEPSGQEPELVESFGLSGSQPD